MYDKFWEIMLVKIHTQHYYMRYIIICLCVRLNAAAVVFASLLFPGKPANCFLCACSTVNSSSFVRRSFVRGGTGSKINNEILRFASAAASRKI
jgi:hypothetical protein